MLDAILPFDRRDHLAALLTDDETYRLRTALQSYSCDLTQTLKDRTSI
ncbi:hypothetical protein SM0020_11095 [Sinorhizobium meliloti CCNWSX0020]|uniref:Uncharacterized protein n=1 Tax=Sinorhizobium meliloti CCNWSX0020 TaxID=1107881 RepID=H0FYD9_RHIML|nr:hypothetical protein SM0020_11095 [Sinorhizobium meliloti CCNWSX0020]